MKNEKDSIYKNIDEDINKVIDNTENIDDLLVIWNEENNANSLSSKRIDRIKNKIRAYLKERKWQRYDNEKTKLSVTLSPIRKEVIDKKQLKLLLTDSQLAQITRVTTSEMMRIITPEARERMKKFIK